MSILHSSRVLVEVDGEATEHEGPKFLTIPRDKIHNVTALTEGDVWYCVFAHRDIEGNVYDPDGNCKEDKTCHRSIPKDSLIIDTRTIPVG
jgi:hypothetical protein